MKIPRIIKQRNTYVDRIRPFMRKTLVKVMVGHRRVGKSFLLYQPWSCTERRDFVY